MVLEWSEIAQWQVVYNMVYTNGIHDFPERRDSVRPRGIWILKAFKSIYEQ